MNELRQVAAVGSNHQSAVVGVARLLIRIIETTTSDTWNNVRRELQRLHVGYFDGAAGTYRQTTETTPAQRRILTRLNLTAPPRILQLDAASG